MAEHMAEVSRHRNRLHELEALEMNRGTENRRLAARVNDLELALAHARGQEEALRRELAARDEALARDRQARPPHQPAPEAPHVQSAPTPQDEAEARLRQRIDRLTELAKAPPPDDFIIHAPPPPPPPPPPAPEEDPLLSEKLAEAERQTEDLTRDLERLDAEWQQRLAEANIAESEADANVITLSNRIRELKKSLGQAS
jgi:cell division septum initiation protein DivIVA